MKSLFSTVLFVILVLASIQTSFAQTQVYFSDHFDQTTLDWHNDWQILEGSTDSWSIQNSNLSYASTKAGQKSLIKISDQAWPTGVNEYNYQFKFRPNPDFDQYAVMKIGESEFGSTYIRMLLQKDSWRIEMIEPFLKIHVSEGEYPPLSEGAWSTFGVHVEHDYASFRVNDMIFMDVIGDRWADRFRGPVGLYVESKSSLPSTVQFDQVLITSPDVDFLGHHVEILKQTDFRWADLEYDSASDWAAPAAPTLSRWGCAVTSMAMVLRYYGITVLPTGQILDPASLNSWLLAQPDGYVGPGLVNWLAVSRLTNLMSPVLNTPKLEYSRGMGSSTFAVQDSLELRQPVIFNVPGHFVVGTSFTDQRNDINILDPAFDLSVLSQHSQVLSARLFEPSFTDLSYIQVVHPVDVTLEVFDLVNGQKLYGTTQLEYIQAAGETARSPQVAISQFAKPQGEEFELVFSGRPQLAEVWMQYYTSTGQFLDSQQVLPISVDPSSIKLQLQLDMDQQVSSAHFQLQEYSWAEFKALWQQASTFAFSQNNLSFYHKYQVDQFLFKAQLSSGPDGVRYAQVINNLLSLNQAHLDTDSFNWLSIRLWQLNNQFATQ